MSVARSVGDSVAATNAADVEGGVWSPERRRLTSGLVLTITLVAFESLAIATIMPTVADDLGGLGLYGWVFSGFFLGSLLGIVLSGHASDERGTRFPFAVGLVLFAAGLVVGGAAQSMPMLVAGRVAQGVGAGAIPAVAYAAVGRSYPADLRPRVFAIFSSAWVVPGLIGPVAAASLAHVLSWRAVFLALIPLVALAGAMTVPALGVRNADEPTGEPADPGTAVASRAAVRRNGRVDAASSLAAGEGTAIGESRAPGMPDGVPGSSAGVTAGLSASDLDPPADRHAATGPGSDHGAPPVGGPAVDPRFGAVALVAGVALVLGGLGVGSPLIGGPLVIVGAVPAVWAFLRLVPAGTVRLASGMPAAVAVRGILTFAFFGTDAYISLAVTDARDQSTWLAGAALTVGTLTWTAGSWVQARVIKERGPRWLVRTGFACLVVATVGMLVVLRPSVPALLILVVWGVGGWSMGISYASLSLTVLALAEPGHEGTASAALQLSDVLGVALGTGLVGVFVALGDARGWATGSSLTLGFTLTLAVTFGGLLAARRLPERLPSS